MAVAKFSQNPQLQNTIPLASVVNDLPFFSHIKKQSKLRII